MRSMSVGVHMPWTGCGRQTSGIGSLLPQWVSDIELRSSTLCIATIFKHLTVHFYVILYLLVDTETSVFVNLEILMPKRVMLQLGRKILTRINWELKLLIDVRIMPYCTNKRERDTAQ